MLHTTWLIKPGSDDDKVSVVARIDEMDGGSLIEQVERKWIADFQSVSQASKFIEQEAGKVLSPLQAFLMAQFAIDQFVLEQSYIRRTIEQCGS